MGVEVRRPARPMFVALMLTAALAFRPSTPRRPASRLRAGDAPEGPAWRSELDAIDEAMWRRLRRELYGGPDCGAPSSLRRFEEYCGLRRANVADDFRVVDGGRRAIYLEEQYPNLTARAIWDAGDFGWIERVVARVPDLREEVAGRALGWREGKWVDTYGHDGAYDSGWGMVHLRDDRFPRATRAFAGAPLAPRYASIARQRAGRAIHTHSDRVPWILTCHVALEGPDDAAYMVVDGERLPWTPGRATVCDTTFFHSAHNDHAARDMHLLHVDFYHPDLGDDERHALGLLHAYEADAAADRRAALAPGVSALEAAFRASSAEK
mmetsp:Transcript_28352/g.91735  ORF Transcript_28352/g.91735 Transcript_28352/m.91735 type:complete len:324 (+) Transcript_28352:417-1388(+)